MVALLILQWNAQSMMGHGEELIRYLNYNRNITYHLLCIQETWFSDDLVMQIPNYKCFSRSRGTQRRGGCAFYVHTSVHYDYPTLCVDIEMQLINIHMHDMTIAVVNNYNPCKKK